jgi:hypothetical protein
MRIVPTGTGTGTYLDLVHTDHVLYIHRGKNESTQHWSDW